MLRRTFRLSALLLTFYVGASTDYYVREFAADGSDCYRVRARCRVVAAVRHPLLALSHPLETLDLLRTARRGD